MTAAVFDASKGSPVVGGLLFAAFAVVVLVWYAADRGARPFIPCPRCFGLGRVASLFRTGAFGQCSRCEGSGQVGRGW